MGKVLCAVLIAVLLTAGSVLIQKIGPTRMVEGEGFCPRPEPCTIEVLGGGFPFAYLVDNPQVSVPESLGIAEDDLRPLPLFADFAVYLSLTVTSLAAVRRWRRDRSGD